MKTSKLDTSKLVQVKEPKETESYYLKDGSRVKLNRILKARDGRFLGYDLSITKSVTERFTGTDGLYTVPATVETTKPKDKK